MSKSAVPSPVTEPIACSLDAGDQAARLADWRALFAGATLERDGRTARVSIDSIRAADAARLIVAEQQCCPFFGFTLEFHGATTALTITVPSVEAVAFVDDLVG